MISVAELQQKESDLLQQLLQVRNEISFLKKEIIVTKQEQKVFNKFKTMDIVNVNGRLWWVKEGVGIVERVHSDELTQLRNLINKNVVYESN